MNRSWSLLLWAAVLAGCAAPEPPRAPPITPPITPPAERGDAAVVRRPLPQTPARPTEPVSPTIVLPADAIYVCVVDSDGTRRQTVIEFSPRVLDLCRRHPEMGPCQYERNACRAAGGRVFAAGGQEITLQTEAEYDKKVLRVRFRSN